MAISYVDRFSVPAAGMRKHLRKKTRESVQEGVVAPAVAEGWIDAIVERLTNAGLIDDERWAESRARVLSRRGKGRRAIQQDLRLKGIGAELIEQAIQELTEAHHNPELMAAYTLARRRRLGPFSTREPSREQRAKDLGKLARQGFSFDVAKRIIDAPDVETLDELLEEE